MMNYFQIDSLPEFEFAYQFRPTLGKMNEGKNLISVFACRNFSKVSHAQSTSQVVFRLCQVHHKGAGQNLTRCKGTYRVCTTVKGIQFSY